MRTLYEQELSQLLLKPDAEIIQYAKGLVDSNNAINWQKANELSFLLRKNRKFDIAVEVASLMYETDPSFDKLNLYFVAVVDQGSFDRIRELHGIVDARVRESGQYQKHLFATWLKAANRIQDDEMFNYVFNMVPDQEKTDNSYIISQYYVFLNRHSRYSEVKKHFEQQLAPNVQNMQYVKKYYINACNRMGFSTHNDVEPTQNPYVPSPRKSNSFDDSLQSSTGANKVFLVYGKQPQILTLIKPLLNAYGVESVDIADEPSGKTIIEQIEEHAKECRFAVVILSPADLLYDKKPDGTEQEKYYPRLNTIFAWGHTPARYGRDNVALVLDNTKGLTYGPRGDFVGCSDTDGTKYIDGSKTTLVEELFARLRKAGYKLSSNG